VMAGITDPSTGGGRPSQRRHRRYQRVADGAAGYGCASRCAATSRRPIGIVHGAAHAPRFA
jgi:hypothetical protein